MTRLINRQPDRLGRWMLALLPFLLLLGLYLLQNWMQYRLIKKYLEKLSRQQTLA